jgi:cation transport protein ChaC
VLGDHEVGCDLWIYSYGSLMWDPGFHFAEVRLADVEGFQRRFTLKINLGRGSHDHPALMLSLEQGEGCCRGLAFRISADSVHAETAILWRREMLRGGYAPAMVPMLTPQGTIDALAFVSNPSHPSYVGELPLDETARLIASGKGILGTNREYLVQLATQLEVLGIQDPYVAQLHAEIGVTPGM